MRAVDSKSGPFSMFSRKFPSNFRTFAMLTVISTFKHRVIISSAHHGKKKVCKNITFKRIPMNS